MIIEIPNEKLTDPRRALEDALCAAWSKGELSGGKAAELLGLSRPEFWQLAGSRRYVWPYTVDDLEQDIETMKKLGQWSS